jgi:hypothetical protein
LSLFSCWRLGQTCDKPATNQPEISHKTVIRQQNNL